MFHGVIVVPEGGRPVQVVHTTYVVQGVGIRSHLRYPPQLRQRFLGARPLPKDVSLQKRNLVYQRQRQLQSYCRMTRVIVH
jgi:hypothetical protein